MIMLYMSNIILIENNLLKKDMEVIMCGNFKHTKNFVVSDKKQVEQFADAIEMSYKESLSESSPSSCRYREIHETDEVYRVMEKWKKLYGG